MVILTEQPSLTNGHFNFTLGLELQQEAKETCIDSLFNIELSLKRTETFTLRRDQYGISYAMYSAVLIPLQYADQDCDDYTQAIQFFWSALLEYQGVWPRFKKKSLGLFKSLMRRAEKVTQRTNTDDPGFTNLPVSSGK